MEQKDVFNVLNAVNVNGHTETKNGLTYLSWAWAWAEIKKRFAASYEVYETLTPEGRTVNYFTDGRTCWVKCSVTIEGETITEMLPVMDVRNNSVTIDKITSMDVNKSVQRCLTKAIARHGLGLYLYAGEDLPEAETLSTEADAVAAAKACKDLTEVAALWKRAREWQANPAFVAAIKECGAALKGGAK